jgi:hypothetical protein
MNPVPPGLRLVALAVFAAALPAAAPAEDAAPPAPAEGFFEKLAPAIRPLVRLGMDGDALCFDRGPAAKATKGDLEQEKNAFQGALEGPFNRLRNETGSHSRGGMGGTHAWGTSFSGSGLAADLNFQRGKIQVTLREEHAPGRSLEVRDDGARGLHVLVTAEQGGLFLVIQQLPSGRFNVALLRGETTFVASEESFASLWRRHRDDVDRKLLPLLSSLGVTVPPATGDAGVREAVIGRLRPVTVKERQEAERLVRQLEDAGHEKREEATRLLSGGYVRYREAIDEALKRPGLDPEAAGRLQRIVEEQGTRQDAEAVAGALGLESDPGYLVRLLASAPEADRPHVVAALEKATGQKLGADAGAWRKWLETAKPAIPAHPVKPAAVAPTREDLEKLKSAVYEELRVNRMAEARAAVEAYKKRFPGHDEKFLEKLSDEIDAW